MEHIDISEDSNDHSETPVESSDKLVVHHSRQADQVVADDETSNKTINIVNEQYIEDLQEKLDKDRNVRKGINAVEENQNVDESKVLLLAD